MSTTHVFGMAKSSLDLLGAKRQKLELDFLRLVYACQHYQANGCQAFGYLAVTSTAIEQQVAKWAKKYLVPPGLVQLVVPKLSDVEQQSLLAEKGRNRLGNLAKADAAVLLKDADGSFGRDLLEAALESSILDQHAALRVLEQHAAIRGSAAVGGYPMGVQWDYYGCY
ncbi:hypothetical protein ACFST9_14520 [Hymenobacter monticola]|uniref:Gluconate 2-dehydrogenase subunit 3 family protein n=1 Tax=Hymenobacter monticola TaxID=1705399 RepID=A0ABY4BD33_9BACT|nr:hypothetical protein [Hymenobacter monticola]UOE36674.1 hypothetical protein MTP16_25180 [Hymenobacter monticola]